MRKLLFTLLLLLKIACLSQAQDERVTIHQKNARLYSFIDNIEMQTDYLFGVDEGINLRMRVSVEADGQPLRKVLDLVFQGTGITYELSGRHIFLSKTKNESSVARRRHIVEEPSVSETQRIDTLKASSVSDSLVRLQKYYRANPIARLGRQIGYDFSNEGRKYWQFELMSSCYMGIRSVSIGGYAFSAGVRLDQNRTWGLGVGKETMALEYNLEKEEFLPVFLWGRHYFTVGNSFSIICDLMGGARFKIIDSIIQKPDVYFMIRPGMDFRIDQFFHAFAGFYVSDELGLFLGITI